MWSFDAEASTRTSGWQVGAHTLNSCASENVARGWICGASAESAGAACHVGEVVLANGDGTVGKFGGVPAVGEERSQGTKWTIVPSEPPEMRIRCTGCHDRLWRVPFDAFDVPTMAGKDLFLSTLHEGPYAPRGQVIHVRLEIVDG